MIGFGILGSPSIRSRIWQLVALACAVLTLFCLTLFAILERADDANRWVQHTETVRATLRDYAEHMIDAETGQRGYLLTRRQEFLAPYRKATAGIEALSAKLRDLTADNPAQQANLQRLDEVARAKLAELGETIRLADAGDIDGALAIVREGRGKRLMDTFRQVRGEVAEVEATLLAERRATLEAENRKVLAVIILGGLLAGGLLAAAAARTISRLDRPLRTLVDGIAAIGEGKLDHQVPISSNDEIGRVTRAFNDMAAHLRSATEARERVEADLAATNRILTAEVKEREAAQARLGRSLAELERSNQELDNFAYVASHDLKAPLRGIRNLADWITEDVTGKVEGETIDNLRLLHNRVERLDLLLESLLAYSRIGRLDGTPEDVDTGRMVADIIEYLAPPAGFTVTCRGSMPVLHTNQAPLEQVFRNLIGNALKHHDRDGGSIVVTVRDLGTLAEFRIEDDGPGIPPAYHERVFMMFQTLKPRDQLEGSGMGLAIVKKTVEGHGGRIRVQSAPPGRGATFVFTWTKG